MEVKTSIGTLVARINNEPEYPGIDIVFVPNGETYEVNVALIEVSHAENDLLANKIVARVWGNSDEEDYTHRVIIRI